MARPAHRRRHPDHQVHPWGHRPAAENHQGQGPHPEPPREETRPAASGSRAGSTPWEESPRSARPAHRPAEESPPVNHPSPAHWETKAKSADPPASPKASSGTLRAASGRLRTHPAAPRPETPHRGPLRPHRPAETARAEENRGAQGCLHRRSSSTWECPAWVPARPVLLREVEILRGHRDSSGRSSWRRSVAPFVRGMSRLWRRFRGQRAPGRLAKCRSGYRCERHASWGCRWAQTLVTEPTERDARVTQSRTLVRPTPRDVGAYLLAHRAGARRGAIGDGATRVEARAHKRESKAEAQAPVALRGATRGHGPRRIDAG